MTEIEELQEQIEDLKEEVRNLRRCHRDAEEHSDEDIQNLKNQLAKAIKESELSGRRCKALERELDRKNQILSFVSSILNAPTIDESANAEEFRKIRSIVDYYITEIIPALKEIRPQYFNILISEIDNLGVQLMSWANLQRKNWLANKKVIAFLGEFSAGKTSIVNRLVGLEKDEGLPEDQKPTTAIPTYITYGVEFTTKFLSPDEDLKVLGKDVFRLMKKDVLEQMNVSGLIKHFVVSYKKEFLKGISILDTPGFNSNDKNDDVRTCEVIAESDVLFWVVDIQMGDVNASSLKIIKDNLKDVPLYIVLNKCDRKTLAEQDDVEKKIVSTLKRYKVPYESIIRFSRNTDVSVLMDVIMHTESKKRGEDILAELYLYLQCTVDYLKKLKSQNMADWRELHCNIDSVEDKVNECHENLNNLCVSLLDDFSYNSGGFFSRPRYELSESEFKDLKESVTDISEKNGEIMNLQDKLSEYRDDLRVLEEGNDDSVGMQSTSDHYTRLKRNLDALNRKIKKWDPSYLKNHNCK